MTHLHRSGFVRAEGTLLVDDDGPLLPRGIGLGNWLLAEGYMWKFGDDMSSPRQIESRVSQLVGHEEGTEFWRRFRDAFITEADFTLIAELGFDHVRLPINARGVMDGSGALLEDGFALIERAVQWCERAGLRIVLDLHGAAGGQTGTNIDDSPNGRPELFTSSTHRAHTVALWQELARRYRDREAVFAYDLLNEPLPNEWQHILHDELIDVYRELTSAVREVDDRHLIMYEGSHWATNVSPLRQRYDENQAIQFHRYWCAPDESSIGDFLALRDALNCPIYMGEGGENTPGWVYAATRLYERHGIGWNFWPWKKLDTLTSPLSARRPEGWERIADPAAQPGAAEASAILDEFLRAVELSACERRPAVVDALFGKPALHLPAWSGMVDGHAATLSTGFDLPEGLWHHTAGEPYSGAERAPVALPAGSTLRFPLSGAPHGWSVDADRVADLDVAWDGEALSLTALAAVRVTAIDVWP